MAMTSGMRMATVRGSDIVMATSRTSTRRRAGARQAHAVLLSRRREVIGSATKHPHPLVCGDYSVHDEDALALGERGILLVQHRTPALAPDHHFGQSHPGGGGIAPLHGNERARARIERAGELL